MSTTSRSPQKKTTSLSFNRFYEEVTFTLTAKGLTVNAWNNLTGDSIEYALDELELALLRDFLKIHG